jgi:hypothetical protein
MSMIRICGTFCPFVVPMSRTLGGLSHAVKVRVAKPSGHFNTLGKTQPLHRDTPVVQPLYQLAFRSVLVLGCMLLSALLCVLL